MSGKCRSSRASPRPAILSGRWCSRSVRINWRLYSSHSMSWQALVDIGFWSTSMVSEDSRIYWHCYFHYNGDYRAEPIFFSNFNGFNYGARQLEHDERFVSAAATLGWGVENIPYLIFNSAKQWKKLPKWDAMNKNLYASLRLSFLGDQCADHRRHRLVADIFRRRSF